MEIVIGIVVTLVVLGLIGHFFGDDENGDSGGNIAEFAVRVREITEKNEENGYVYPAFEVQVRGMVPVPHDQCPVEMRLHMFDGPEDDLKPVLCQIEQLQEPETQAFEWRSDTFPMPFNGGLAEWTTMVTIPKEVLVFPARGARRLGFQFSVVAPGNPPQFQYGFTDGTTGVIYALAQTVRQHECEEVGYEDGEENRKVALNTAVELSLHMAALGGEVGRAEADVVKQWMKQVTENMPEEVRKEEKAELKRVAARAFNSAVKGESDLDEIVGRMNGAASTQDKYNALELCIDVMAADGKAEASEIQALDRIARMLRVDPKQYRELREQRMAKLADVGEVSQNLDTMLGITADMSPDEVKSHLTAQYRKWNSRVSHSDEKVRKRAEEMLLLIGEVRAKYVD